MTPAERLALYESIDRELYARQAAILIARRAYAETIRRLRVSLTVEEARAYEALAAGREAKG